MTVAKAELQRMCPCSGLLPLSLWGKCLFLLSLCEPVRESLAESLGEMTQGLLLMRRPAGGKRSKTPNQRTNWNSRHLHLCSSPSFTVEASLSGPCKFLFCSPDSKAKHHRDTYASTFTDALFMFPSYGTNLATTEE